MSAKVLSTALDVKFNTYCFMYLFIFNLDIQHIPSTDAIYDYIF